MPIIDLKSPMTGTVFLIQCSVGEKVESGDDLIVLEAMKMEVPIVAENPGVIVEILVDAATIVNEGDVLVRIDTDGLAPE